MKKCFVLASSSDRTNLLNKCINCINKNSLYKDTDVFLFFQGKDHSGIEDPSRFKKIIFDDNLRGIFTPRYELFKLVKDYDFVILIDDDLFLYPDTTYEGCISFLQFMPNAGCINIGTHRRRRSNEIVCISDKMGDYNVEGGLVFPKKSIELILEYFKDKEDDYTEDMFWLLLYVKGYDLYQYRGSNAIHIFNVKGENNEATGYTKMRYEKPYKPILSEWFNDTVITTENGRFKPVHDIKCLKDINEKGISERMKYRGKAKNRD